MGVVYQPGQELGGSDLRVYFRDRAGTLTNMYEVLYSLYYWDPTAKEYTVMSGLDRLTAEEGVTTGHYWIAWDIPSGANCGAYKVVWTYKTTMDAPYQQVSTEFSIVKVSVGSYRSALVADLYGAPYVIVP